MEFSSENSFHNYKHCGVWRLLKVRGKRQGCVAERYLTPYFGYIILPHVDWSAQCLAQRKSQKKYTKRKDRKKDKRRKYFFYTFLYLLGEGTNRRYVLWRSVVPKTPDSKMVLLVRRTLSERERWYRFLFQVENPFFFYACVFSFSVRDLWGVSSNLIVFFLSIYLFIYFNF